MVEKTKKGNEQLDLLNKRRSNRRSINKYVYAMNESVNLICRSVEDLRRILSKSFQLKVLKYSISVDVYY